MASSRLVRKSSRMASPLSIQTKEPTKPEIELHIPKETVTLNDDWTEPPLRTPAPSFEDYKGLERHGVLEHMAPLGSLPNQKVRLRVKNHEAPRRVNQSKPGEVVEVKEAVKTAKTADTLAVTRRSESRKAEDQPTKSSLPREKDDDQDYTPKGPLKQAHHKVHASRSSLNGTPSSRTAAGQERLRQVVDSAVERSYELGTPILGLAVRKLFEESLQNRTLADLLDAVLSQRPTPRQASDFQSYIKVARKQIKAENGLSRRASVTGLGSSSKSSSKSPSKVVRPSPVSLTNFQNDAKIVLNNEARPVRQHQQHTIVLEGNKMVSPGEQHPAKRVKRSKSTSSTSSLSSLSSIEPSMDLDHSNLEVLPSAQSLPATKRSALLEPKLHNFSTARVAGPSKQRSSNTTATVHDDSVAELATKRQKLSKSFNDVLFQDSHIRTSPKPMHRDEDTTERSQVPNSSSSSTQQIRLRNGTSRSLRGEDYGDIHSSASSAQGELLVPPPPGAQSQSRFGTPNQFGRLPKPIRKAARVKMSPMKKKSGVIAGIARMGGGRDSPVGYGHMDDNEDHDNVDYCTACSGNGQLLCCDGCTRSFHFTCLDPPMDPNRPPEGEWYCYICESRRDPQPKPPRGLFAALLAVLEKKNPIAFNLPYDIRDYFEGVKTGEEGEYEEATTLKSKTRSGYDETPDNYKLKDAKGNYVLCFKCGKSSLGHREIIPCDFCNLHWHLDCLDPPMANPPQRGNNGRPRNSWMCPNHIDQELQALDSSARNSAKAQSSDGRTHKVRRPKNARIVDTALRRGFVNNGLVEIENEPTDDEEEEEAEKESFGVVYRIPERGVKLDFIDRVKRSHREVSVPLAQQKLTLRARDDRKLRVVATARAQKESFDKRPLAERKAALNLAQFAQSNADVQISADEVENLINTLVAEAPHEVVAMCTSEVIKDDGKLAAAKDPSVPPTPPESDLQEHGVSELERKGLLMIQELIRRRLGESNVVET